MSLQEREEWNHRYSEGEYRIRKWPSALLLDWLPRLPGGHALDVATGVGRNALLLAQQGFVVDAIDVSAVALNKAAKTAKKMGLVVNWIEADLDAFTLQHDAYHVIVNSFYLNRNLVPSLKESLKRGGYILFEHHFMTAEPVDGPKNPNFRLRPNELLHLFYDLSILFYQEGIFQEEDRTIAVSKLVAQRT